MGVITFSRVLTIAVCGYILYSLSSFYKIFHLDECKSSHESQHCIYPRFNSDIEYALDITGYAKSSASDKQLLLQMSNMRLNESFSRVIELRIPGSIKRNRSRYVIQVVLKPVTGNDNDATVKLDMELSKQIVPLATVYNLLGQNQSAQAAPDPQGSRPAMHLYKKIVITTLSELPIFDYHQVPQEISQLLKVTRRGSNGQLVYQPIIYINSFLLSQDDLVRVSGPDQLDSINITIELAPVSVGKLRLWRLIEHATQDLNKLGFNDKSVDSVRGIFTNTNFYLLVITFSVAALHLLFDVLSFKNDISFWRNARTTRGLSGRTVMWRCVSSIIVLLYLMEEDTSLLVLLPFGASTLIEFWKLARIFKVTISWTGTIRVDKRDQGELDTDSFDSEGTRYLMWLVVPLCIGGAVYSLLYQPHKSWYSWTVTTLANGVYVFGFLFMTPQLFINYKLKSVAHLPWKALTYKAFNTFIDDFFAFIITMPTSHRLACFRDDIVFVVYIYQRWLYPVDKSRVNEFGQAFDSPEVSADSHDKKIR